MIPNLHKIQEEVGYTKFRGRTEDENCTDSGVRLVLYTLLQSSFLLEEDELQNEMRLNTGSSEAKSKFL